MELYRKKFNLGTKPNSGQDEGYEDRKNLPSQRLKNVYLQNLLKQNREQFPNDYDASHAGKNIPNIRSSMEDIFADDNNKKKALKYIIQKNRNMQSPDSKKVSKRLEKSASPMGRGGKDKDYADDSREETPIRKVLNLSREPYYSAVGNKFNTINNDKKPSNNLKTTSGI